MLNGLSRVNSNIGAPVCILIAFRKKSLGSAEFPLWKAHYLYTQGRKGQARSLLSLKFWQHIQTDFAEYGQFVQRH